VELAGFSVVEAVAADDGGALLGPELSQGLLERLAEPIWVSVAVVRIAWPTTSSSRAMVTYPNPSSRPR
jgi:hypothetical protein